MKPPEMFAWCDALRSGEYAERVGQMPLRSGERGSYTYNAFGVLTMIYPWRHYRSRRTNDWGLYNEAPTGAAKWLTGRDYYPQIQFPRNTVPHPERPERYIFWVSEMCTLGWGFNQIADALETYGITTAGGS